MRPCIAQGRIFLCFSPSEQQNYEMLDKRGKCSTLKLTIQKSRVFVQIYHGNDGGTEIKRH